jgi:hypothetical protein
MKRAWRTSHFAALALALSLVPAPFTAAEAAGLMDAIQGGKPNLDLRYRYERVDQDGIADAAMASTLRTRLGYTTAPLNGYKAMVEFENITAIDGDEYNSTRNDKTGRPVVADPEGSEVNRAALIHEGDTVTTTVGRQRIKLDNERHVGNVGWRQNEQTYDAAMATFSRGPDTHLRYAYVWNVNDSTFGNTDVEAHLIHLSRAAADGNGISTYAYLINNNAAPATSTRTLGARYTGTFDRDAGKALLTLEYANQSDYQDAPGTIDADYWFGEIGEVGDVFTTKLGYEVLGGNGTYAFQTPLATKHAFNGWADKFLTTPATGLVDLMVTLSGSVAGANVVAAYHDFSADSGSTDYGTEWDLMAARKVGDVNVGVKYATFNADTATLTDTDKLWLFAETGF